MLIAFTLVKISLDAKSVRCIMLNIVNNAPILKILPPINAVAIRIKILWKCAVTAPKITPKMITAAS